MGSDDLASLNRVHDRIDELKESVNNGMTEVKVAIARLEAVMPKQPCPGLIDLKRDVEQTKEKGWQLALKLLAICGTGGGGGAALVTYLLGK